MLRRVLENTADPTTDKFQPNWEGPYMVLRVGPDRSYILDKLDRTPVPRMWNVMPLRSYYQEKVFFFKGIINKVSFRVFYFNS